MITAPLLTHWLHIVPLSHGIAPGCKDVIPLKNRQILINRKTEDPSITPHWPPFAHPSAIHLAPKSTQGTYFTANCAHHSLCRPGHRPCVPCVQRGPPCLVMSGL